MAYSATNPPLIISKPFGSSPAFWQYTSNDTPLQIIASGYITNGSDLGVNVGDMFCIVNSSTGFVYQCSAIAVTAGGAATLSRAIVIPKPIEVLSSSAVAVACATTAVDEVLAQFTIPAGTLGVNSILQFEPLWTFASSGNNKITKVKVGASTVYTATRTTSVKEGPLVVLANRNSLAVQIQPYDNNYVTAGSGAPATFTIDFSVDVIIQITGQQAASDSLKLEYYRVLHFVGD